MKSNKKYLIIPVLVFLMISISTNFFSNIWMLITDNSNYIPSESNILSFTPIQIDEGSGGYWRYGEDRKKYYYFSLDERHVYFSIKKENHCPNFSKTDFVTWCEKNKFSR